MRRECRLKRSRLAARAEGQNSAASGIHPVCSTARRNCRKEIKMRKAKQFNPRDAVRYSRGAIVSKAILDKRSGSVTLFAFAAGQALSEHTAPYDALVAVLDGEAELTIGGKVITAKAGEMVVMPANVPHAVRAAARFKMLLIMIRK